MPLLHFSPRLTRRRHILFVSVILLVFIFTRLRLHGSNPEETELVVSNRQPPPPDSACSSDLSYLRRKEYRLTAEIIYQRHCVRALLREGTDRQEVKHVPQSIVQAGDLLQKRTDCDGWRAPVAQDLTCREPLDITVPPAFPAQQYGNFLFGVATTFDRMIKSLPQFAHWLGNSGATLVAVVVDAQKKGRQVDDLVDAYQAHGINIVVEMPWDPSVSVNKQHFTIIQNMVQHLTPQTEWVAIIDDDTFFPSLFTLSSTLKQYDSKASTYLGGMSESHYAIEKHGFQAYGGAGIFLSVPLVKELRPVLNDCLQDKTVKHGDALLNTCILKYTEAEFTVVPGLRQMDLNGDLSGFYESGQLPLSLHHWKSWHHVPVDKMAKTSDFCGGCFLQRWQLGTDTIFTNGYSIALYPKGMAGVTMNEMEGTWDRATKWKWDLGPLRPAFDETQKKNYILLDSEQVGPNLRQLYIHRAGSPGGWWNKNKIIQRDEIIELWWEWLKD
jgi:hypothetical protein